MRRYQENENDEFVRYRDADEPKIDLRKHIGMYKPVTPGFGVPLIRFSLNPIEKYSDYNFHNFQDLKNAQQEIKVF